MKLEIEKLAVVGLTCAAANKDGWRSGNEMMCWTSHTSLHQLLPGPCFVVHFRTYPLQFPFNVKDLCVFLP